MRRRLLLPSLSLLLPVLSLVPAVAHADSEPRGEWPLTPVPDVVARFDPPATTWGAGHRGVDLGGHPGQQVRAALPGTVLFAGTVAGRGVVTVEHGATRTTYEPVVAGVRRGTEVAAGDTLGSLALAGSHCFPRTCLHWGWLRGPVYLDPLTLVGAGRVRLLPLTGLVRTGPLGDRPVGATGVPHPYAEWRSPARWTPGLQP